MTSVVAKSFGYQLDSLTQYIQANYNWESPDSGFAHYVFYRADSQAPFSVVEDSFITNLEVRRLHQAPVLAAVGYELACGRAFNKSFLEAWANGLTRLSTREAFPSDRVSFFYRPVELLGISLGAKNCSEVRVEDLSWLKNVLTEGEHKLGHSELWAFFLSIYAAQTLSISWKSKNLPPLEEMNTDELALLKWICDFEQSLAESFRGNQLEGSSDKALLERCITTPFSVQETSRASVLYLSLNKAVTEVFQLSWEQYSRIGRNPEEDIKLIKSIGNSFHLAAQRLQLQNNIKLVFKIIDISDIQELLNVLSQIRSDTDSLAAKVIEVVSQKSGTQIINNQGIMITGDNVTLSNNTQSLANKVETGLQYSSSYAETYHIQGDTVSETFNNDLREAKVANFANKVQDNARQQANQYVYESEHQQTLAEAAEEIQNLLKVLEKTNPTATQADKQAFVTAAIAPPTKERIVKALQAGGEKALEEFLKNPYVNVVAATIKGWYQAQ